MPNSGSQKQCFFQIELSNKPDSSTLMHMHIYVNLISCQNMGKARPFQLWASPANTTFQYLTLPFDYQAGLREWDVSSLAIIIFLAFPPVPISSSATWVTKSQFTFPSLL